MYKNLIRPKWVTIANLNPYTCMCNQKPIKVWPKNVIFTTTRVHSTNQDQHRQKVVIETSTPKLVFDKPLKGTEKDGLSLLKRIDPYVKLMRLDKPIGIYLLYFPCTWSIALGGIHTGWAPDAMKMLLLFGAGATLMRGAGCTLNDLVDRDIDAQVERTKSRPLVTGAITKKQAVAFLAAQLSLSLAILLQLNWYSVILGASSMVLVVAYPFAKRYTNYPQLVLGATFNWGALLGYSATVGSVDPYVCGPLYLGSVAWTVLYDTIYAHQDKIDDARIGIKSTALTFGASTKPILYATAGFSAACFALSGYEAGLGLPFYAALAACSTHSFTQVFTLNIDNPEDCAKKFKSNTFIGLLMFLGILAGGYDVYRDNNQKLNKKVEKQQSDIVIN